MSENNDFYELLDPYVKTAAMKVGKWYGTVTTPEDCAQEIWLWLACDQSRGDQFWEWLDESQEDQDLKQGQWRTARRLESVAVRYARREKAARGGYESTDDFHYSRGLLEGVMPTVWHGAPVDTALDPHSPNSKSDPAEGGSLLAMTTDAAGALWALEPDERELLALFYAHDLDIDEVAEETESAPPTIHRKVGRAMDKLVRATGGFDPALELRE